jgi:hypothetical protein
MRYNINVKPISKIFSVWRREGDEGIRSPEKRSEFWAGAGLAVAD